MNDAWIEFGKGLRLVLTFAIIITAIIIALGGILP